MSILWSILPQPFPAPIFVQDYEITRAKGCRAYCAVCRWGYLVAWSLLLCVAGLLGAWMWLLLEMNYAMPHTFAWEALLRPFGSATYVAECASNSTETSAAKLASDCWTSSFTLPCVPIIACMILIMTVINGIWCLLPVPLLNLYSAVLSMRANLAWHLFFFPISFVVVSIFFGLDLVGLQDRMNSAINTEGDNYTISPTWALTQSTVHCCGMISYGDWKPTTGLYPPSCCNPAKDSAKCANGKLIPASSVWATGCYNSEYNKVLLYGLLELILIWCTYFISLALYKMIVSLSLKQYEEARAGGDVTNKAEGSQGQNVDPGPSSFSPNTKTPLLSQQH